MARSRSVSREGCPLSAATADVHLPHARATRMPLRRSTTACRRHREAAVAGSAREGAGAAPCRAEDAFAAWRCASRTSSRSRSAPDIAVEAVAAAESEELRRRAVNPGPGSVRAVWSYVENSSARASVPSLSSAGGRGASAAAGSLKSGARERWAISVPGASSSVDAGGVGGVDAHVALGPSAGLAAATKRVVWSSLLAGLASLGAPTTWSAGDWAGDRPARAELRSIARACSTGT